MAFVRRQTEVVCTVPGATVRLTAVTTGVEVRQRVARFQLVHAAPHHVEMTCDDGRVDVVRTRDLDLVTRIAIVAFGAVVVRQLGRRRSNP